MVQMEKLNCSNCGASLEVDPDAKVILCRFCGTQLLLETDTTAPAATDIIDRKHEAEVRQWFEKLGIGDSLVTLDWVYDLNLQKKKIIPSDMKLLEYLPNIRGLQMQDSDLDDSGAVYIKSLHELQWIFLTNTAVSDLSFLSGLEKFETLYATGTRVNDRSLEALSGLPALKALDLQFTQVTDEGMKHLSSIRSLEKIDISGTAVTIKGLKILSELPSLEDISYPKSIKDAPLLRAGLIRMHHVKTVIALPCAKIKDEELKELGILKHIEMLDLRSNLITDPGIAYLKGHTFLNYLDLSHNKLTDACIENFAEFRMLSHLDLSGNSISKNGEGELKKILPGATVNT